MSSKFIKRNESFTCLNCGTFNKQDASGSCRNHCYYCLYSLHVDIYPGDRKEVCKSLMKPISVDIKGGNISIYHKCLGCRKVIRNKSLKDDNIVKYYETN